MSRIAFILAAAISITAAPVPAHDYTAGSLKIIHPWARATPKGASVGAGYLAIVNNGSTPDRFIGGSSDVAEHIEIHQMSMEKGVMKMRERPSGLEIKPGETVEFKPSGYHAMFVGLHKPLTQGEHVNATLKFEKAGTINVYFAVESIGTKDPGRGKHESPNMSDTTDHHMPMH